MNRQELIPELTETIDLLESESELAMKLLFDDVSQLLYSVILGVQLLEDDRMEPEVRQHFKELQKLTVSRMEEIRRAASQSHYYGLASFGFLHAYRRWEKQYEDRHGIKPNIVVEGMEEGERLDRRTERLLFRMCTDWAAKAASGKLPLILKITKQRTELSMAFIIREGAFADV